MTRIAVVVSVLAVALVTPAVAAPAKSNGKFLPARGILQPGKSLAGVRLGDTVARVKSLWGKNYKVWVCREKNCPTTWLYIYPQGEPLGGAVRFRSGRVVTVFTLGSPSGWRTAEGLLLGEQVERVTALYGKLAWSVCTGYGAMSMRTNDAVTSIYTTGESVYGFALSRPQEPICN